MAASFPLYTTQMFNNMGFQYAGLLMSLLIAIAIPLPFILIWKGADIRRRSPYAAIQTGVHGGSEGPVREARRAKIDRMGEKDAEVPAEDDESGSTPTGHVGDEKAAESEQPAHTA